MMYEHYSVDTGQNGMETLFRRIVGKVSCRYGCKIQRILNSTSRKHHE